jgi:hypothetical protein
MFVYTIGFTYSLLLQYDFPTLSNAFNYINVPGNYYKYNYESHYYSMHYLVDNHTNLYLYSSSLIFMMYMFTTLLELIINIIYIASTIILYIITRGNSIYINYTSY